MSEWTPAGTAGELAGTDRALLHRSLRELAYLDESTKILRYTLDFDALLKVAVTTMVRVFEPSEVGVIFLYDEGRRRLVTRAASGHRDESLFQVELEAGEGLPGQAFHSAQTIACSSHKEVVKSLQSMSEKNRQCFEQALGWPHDCCCAVCAPLISRTGIIGSILYQSAHPPRKPYSPFAMQVAQTLADQIALAIENAQLWQELQRKEESLTRLLATVISAQEGERKRIARELHDEAGQALSTVIMGLGMIEEMPVLSTEEARGRIKQVRGLTIHALGEIRKLILDLRPTLLDDLGLIPALRWYAKDQLGRSGIDIELVVSGFDGTERSLPFQVETALFRIVQEALTNVIKHAEAKKVTVQITSKDRRVSILVHDDGKGFNASGPVKSSGLPKSMDMTRHLGLLGIAERVALLDGTFSIESQPGKGTSLVVQIPLTLPTIAGQEEISVNPDR